MRSVATVLLFSLFQLTATCVFAGSTTYIVEAPAVGDAVVFTSRAPLEDFKGRTNKIAGDVIMDPDDLASGIQLRVEVDLASLDTGIGLRNTHMRNNHLHTEQFPLATFVCSALGEYPVNELPVGAPVQIELVGTLELHGIRRQRRLVMQVLRDARGFIYVDGVFNVSLEAHEIPRPKFLIMKLADEQEVSVNLQARPQLEGEQ